MCGINIILDKKEALDATFIQQMNAALNHRGPDHSGFTKKHTPLGTLYLGHTRLKIVDLSDNANQPYVTENWHLTVNGEIYNHQELRAELDKPFLTHCDTETLGLWLEKHGTSRINDLKGMFAFAHWSAKSNTLLLARDQAGMKPLYYYEDDSIFMASSEITSFWASGLIQKELNQEAVYDYLNFKYVIRPNTMFQNIKELEPGHYLKIETSNSTSEHPFPASGTTTKKDLKQLLHSSLDRHLMGDVPVGLYLSGGVDSTLLLALLAERDQVNELQSFSIGNRPSDGSYGTSDGEFAKKAVKQYGGQLSHIEFRPDHLNSLQDLISNWDQPIGDLAALPTWVLSQAASNNGYKVVLTGAGADEHFMGYNRHLAFHKYLKSWHNNPIKRTAIKCISPLLPSGKEHRSRDQFRMIKKFAHHIDKDPTKTFQNFTKLDWPFSFPDHHSNSIDASKIDSVKLALYRDQRHYLVSDVLMMTDRMTMMHGVEARMPFLDQDIINFAQDIHTLPTNKTELKASLKSILVGLGGKQYTERKKAGFGFPFGQWVRESGNEILSIFANGAHRQLYNFVSHEQVAALTKQHLSKKVDYSQELWALLVLDLWLEKNFD